MNATQMDALTGGIMVFWDAKPTSHARLRAAMERVGVEQYCPPPYSVGESLKRAMSDYGRGNRKALLDGLQNVSNTTLEVKRHEKADTDGYEMVAVEHGKERNEYTRLFGADINCNGVERVNLTFGWSVVNAATEMQDAYERNRRTVSASAVGQMLVKMVKLMNGTCVREIGGVYYLPDGCDEAWQELCQAVEEENGTQISWHEIRMNESTMRTIAQAITKELTEVANKLLEEVSNGELGARALDNRISAAKTLRDKCEQYEVILDSPLQEVRKALEEAETAAATAHMLAAAQMVAE